MSLLKDRPESKVYFTYQSRRERIFAKDPCIHCNLDMSDENSDIQCSWDMPAEDSDTPNIKDVYGLGQCIQRSLETSAEDSCI